jgi:hypothetical protein
MKVANLRLESQLLVRRPFAKPSEVVRWFGAIQAQDYLGALWALGVRTRAANERSVQAALDDGSVLRVHGFRGTWQFVAQGDVRWMLELVGNRVIAAAASRFREVELDAKLLGRTTELFEAALEGGKELTRAELAAVLSQRRIPSAGRLSHILAHAELRGVLVSGARRGKQSTYTLLGERAPKARTMTREQALAELAKRYFQSRGPATERDFAWWSGLSLGDVREAIALAKPQLHASMAGERRYFRTSNAKASGRGPGVHLLPAFDELLVAYQNRDAFLDPAHVRAVNAGGGMLKPMLVSRGRVLGTWQRKLDKRGVTVTLKPIEELVPRDRAAVRAATERYAAFLELPLRARSR